MPEDIFLIILGTAGGIASIAGLSVALYSIFFRGLRGALEVRIISRMSYSRESFGGRAQLQVYGQSLTEASLINGKFVNNSSRVLLATDFETPVTLRTRKGHLVDWVVTNKEPDDLNIELEEVDGNLHFTRGIFQKGEFVSFQLIVDWADAELQLSGRTPVRLRLVEQTGDSYFQLGLWPLTTRSLPFLAAVFSGLLGAITLALFAVLQENLKLPF